MLFACGGGRLLCCLLVVVGGCCIVRLWWCEVVLFALGGVLLSCYAVALPYFVVGTGLFTLYVQRRKGGMMTWGLKGKLQWFFPKQSNATNVCRAKKLNWHYKQGNFVRSGLFL